MGAYRSCKRANQSLYIVSVSLSTGPGPGPGLSLFRSIMEVARVTNLNAPEDLTISFVVVELSA